MHLQITFCESAALLHLPPGSIQITYTCVSINLRLAHKKQTKNNFSLKLIKFYVEHNQWWWELGFQLQPSHCHRVLERSAFKTRILFFLATSTQLFLYHQPCLADLALTTLPSSPNWNSSWTLAVLTHWKWSSTQCRCWSARVRTGLPGSIIKMSVVLLEWAAIYSLMLATVIPQIDLWVF